MYFPRYHTEPEDRPVMDAPIVFGVPSEIQDCDPMIVDQLVLHRRTIVLVSWNERLLTREDVWHN